VISSINLGQPLVEAEPGSKVSLEIRRIAAAIAGPGAPPPPAQRKGFLRSVFHRAPAPSGALNLGVTLDEA
jgi:MinD-like ATPase involved in chromosome partitioning or flagellar assembly